MAIKNYTSEVSIEKSMANIEKYLVSAGARNIMKEYNDLGACTSISFAIISNGSTIVFNIPSRLDLISKKMMAKYIRPTDKSHALVREQAGRTAWKIISDWVEIQVTMIMLDQAEMKQLFLAYMYDGKETFYDKFERSDFKQLK